VAWNNAIDPSLILNQYETPDCDGECPPDPVYFCCEDTTGDKDCYKYGCPPDRVEVGGPYSTPRECSIDCGVKYYCCEDSDGNKTCRDDECEYYGENTVGGPYDTKDLCEPECEKYYCCEDSNGERNCYKGTCPAGTEEKGGPYDDDVACKEAACAKVYWYCTAPDKCESSDSGPYDTEDACLDGAPEDCKEAYACQDNGDGTKTCVQDPNGEYDTDDCGGECEKPKKYSCVNGDCVLDPNGGYDDPNCDGACTKQKYACVGGVCVPDDNGPYDEDTCGGNCVKPECVVDADCGCDAPDTWFEGFGCCQDGQVPKPGTNQCWEDGRPGTETSLVATGECCNGQCVELCIGGCCTEYGLSYVSRKQCKEWGGTFHAPGEVFDTTCGCDCAGTGGQVSIPSACTKLSTWTRCDDVEGEYCSEESGQQESYAGYSPQFPQDDPAGLLDTIREKGAQIIGWVDIGSSFAQKPGDQEQTRCCLISGSRNKMKYRTFALNCRQKKWEEVANILAQYDSEGVGGTGGTGATCNGQTILASENPIPPAVNFVASAPTCIPPAAANPLP
jgi:hypothetical protein